jgi:hypothetical protein
MPGLLADLIAEKIAFLPNAISPVLLLMFLEQEADYNHVLL